MVSQRQSWVKDPRLPIPNAVLFPNSKEELYLLKDSCVLNILSYLIPYLKGIKFTSYFVDEAVKKQN